MWRDFKKESDICNVLCKELFMLDVRHSQIDAETKFDVASLILIFFINFSFYKMIFSIVQVSLHCERLLTASVRRFTLCGKQSERSLSGNNWEFKNCTCACSHDPFRAERHCNLFVVALIASYSETDSIKFKDASFVITLAATYSETDSAKSAKFQNASL